MRTLLLAAGVAALSLSLPAAAAEREADDGLYLRGAAGRADLGGLSGAESVEGDAGTWSLGTGWRFANYFSLDANVDRLGEFDGTGPGAGGPFETRLTTLSLGLGATVDFGKSGFFGQARVGMHQWKAKYENFETAYDTDGVDPFWSLGIGYDVTELFGVILSYERFAVGDERIGDMDRLMLGFELR